MPRGKRPAVEPATQKEWARLAEEEGLSPPQIAVRYGYDVRTVRQYLEKEADLRQRQQATLMVYHDALQSHFRDMIRLAEDLDREVKKDNKITFSQEPLHLALKEHTRRTPLSKKLQQWNDSLDKINRKREDIQIKTKKMLENFQVLAALGVTNPQELIGSLCNLLMAQADRWAQKSCPLNVQENFRIDRSENGLVLPRYGPYGFGVMTPSSAMQLKQLISQLETDIQRWEDIAEMRTLINAKTRSGAALNEELSYIIYRRVLPGKCRYCPL